MSTVMFPVSWKNRGFWNRWKLHSFFSHSEVGEAGIQQGSASELSSTLHMGTRVVFLEHQSAYHTKSKLRQSFTLLSTLPYVLYSSHTVLPSPGCSGLPSLGLCLCAHMCVYLSFDPSPFSESYPLHFHHPLHIFSTICASSLNHSALLQSPP